MDPITQGVVGVSATQLVAHPKEKFIAAAIGFLAGMSADLDVLIRSSSDPILALEYHRHFTHSLIFIPLGALVCALTFFYLLRPARQQLGFTRIYLFCFAGYATHAVLDACTTYGTQLFWPFSSVRVAWNNVSVVDPLFTLPLMILVLIAMFRRSTPVAVLAASYALVYLSMGVLQAQRAEGLALQLAQSRGHKPINLGVKPSFGNIVVWKSVYEFDGHYYVDAVRVLVESKVLQGTSTEKLNLQKHYPWINGASQQAKDIERFRWFSDGHLALDPDNSLRIIDMRYSLLPHRADGMWGIVLDPLAQNDAHVGWTTTRPKGKQAMDNVRQLWQILKGDNGGFLSLKSIKLKSIQHGHNKAKG